nr:MAG TPA: hypothetical protein [Caudoviricetes sp.]
MIGKKNFKKVDDKCCNPPHSELLYTCKGKPYKKVNQKGNEK